MTTHQKPKIYIDLIKGRPPHTEVLMEFWSPADDIPQIVVRYDQNYIHHRLEIGHRVGTWLRKGAGYAVCSETISICGETYTG